MIKVAIVTGSRAEYGLLQPLIKALSKIDSFKVQIFVTGMHLSPEFGLTYKQIEEDGYTIDAKVEMLLSSDTEEGITKSIGLGMIGFADVFKNHTPNLVVVLGDRFETYAVASAAFIAKIPIAHLHGGELTQGLIDDGIRHSITKLSYLHFTSTETYRKRVIQLGEHPDRVFNVGAIGLDSINTLNLLTKEELESSINFLLNRKTILVTFHPVTLDFQSAESQFNDLLTALKSFTDINIIFTKPNADTDGRIIIKMIDQYVAENPDNSISFISLGQLRYLSALKYVSAVVGNSSSGIIEVPSFGKATINIGDRQKGRIQADSVINCSPNKEEIVKAINLALQEDFQDQCKKVKNPYGEGSTSDKILKVLLDMKDKIFDIKKEFYDIKECE